MIGISANGYLKCIRLSSLAQRTQPNYSVWWESGGSDSGTIYGDVNGDATADFGIEIGLVGLSQIEAKHIVL